MQFNFFLTTRPFLTTQPFPCSKDLQSETSKAYFQKQLSLIFLISTEIMADSTLTSSITPTSSSTPFAAAGTHHLHSTGTHIHTMKCHILFHCISYLSPAVLRFQQVQQEPLSFDLGPVLPTRLQILSIISSAFARISTDVR